MRIIEKENFPVKYEDILVFPEYFTSIDTIYSTTEKYSNSSINYYIVGVGKSYDNIHTTILLLDKNRDIIGVRQKLSPFLGEGIKPASQLKAFELKDERLLGIIVCKEVLHTAIAEVYRLMGVNIIAVSIGGGDFWDLQRQSWMDQMSLFSDITNSPLICSCGASKKDGGINLIIER